MGSRRTELAEVLNSRNTYSSLSYWTHLLNFFDQNINDLDIHDVRILAKESEKCRIECNQETHTMVEITKNGNQEKIKVVYPGMGIKKEEVSPNITNHLKVMEMAEEEQEIEETVDKSHKTDYTPPTYNIIPLAAKPV